MKASMIFYRDWYEMAKSLSDEERLMIYDAVMEYAFDGKSPEDKFIKTATALMLSSIDRDNLKYKQTCERRREAGKKGGEARWANSNQWQMPTNDSKCQQMIANVASVADNDNVNDNDNDNEDDNDSTKRIVSDDTIRESGPLSPVTPPIDINELAKFFNSEMKRVGALIPTIKTISGQRKTHTLARIREYGKETFAQMIRMAAESDFLNGKNAKGWTANYDWLVLPNNFVKVIEGNYNNRQHGSRTQFDSGAGQEGTGGSGYDSTL